MTCSRLRRRPATSFLQVLVVMALLLMLMSLAAPAVVKIREAAHRTQSVNNLKHLALAMHEHHDVHNAFPPAVGTNAGQTGPAHFHLLPYLEQQNMFDSAKGKVWTKGTYGKVVEGFLDPRDASLPGHVHENWLATTNYAINWMISKEGAMRVTDIPDGTSNTLMFAQRYQMCNGQPTAWGYPSIYTWAPMFAFYSEEMFQSAPPQAACNPQLPQSIGREMLIAFCDGSVRTISPDIAGSTWYYLTDPADGNVIPLEAFN